MGNNFSLYFDDWKNDWIEEFINFLYKNIEPKNVYEVELIGLQGYFASDYQIFIFESNNDKSVFILHLSVSD
ncbi:MAG: hypothetical protein KUL74_07480 [Cloacibacterium sp.]|nr:hypothetical protein [Cloacibacterium sp.]